MVYWISNSAGTAAQLYKETLSSTEFHELTAVSVKQPTGVAMYPKEVAPPKRMQPLNR